MAAPIHQPDPALPRFTIVPMKTLYLVTCETCGEQELGSFEPAFEWVKDHSRHGMFALERQDRPTRLDLVSIESGTDPGPEAA